MRPPHAVLFNKDSRRGFVPEKWLLCEVFTSKFMRVHARRGLGEEGDQARLEGAFPEAGTHPGLSSLTSLLA